MGLRAVITAALLLHASSAAAQQAECWDTSINLSTPLALSCAALIETSAVAVGGIRTCCPAAGGEPTPALLTLDLQQRFQWRAFTDLPVPIRGHASCAVHDDTIAVSPAAQDPGAAAAPSDTLLFVDVTTGNQWTSTARMMFPRTRAALTGDAHHIYVVGGLGVDGNPVHAIEHYNGTAWSVLLRVVMPLCDCAVAAHSEEAFLVCSNCTSEVRTQVVQLNFRTKTYAVGLWDMDHHRAQVSVSGAVIGQYAVFNVLYPDRTDPAVLYWDLYLQQLHTMATDYLPVPRAHGASFVAENRLYYIGGQYFPAPNDLRRELVDNVDYVPVTKRAAAHLFDRENRSYTVGERITVLCPTDAWVRIASSARCFDDAAGTEPTKCISGAALLQPTKAARSAFVCLSPGICNPVAEGRRMCSGDFTNFRTCNQGGCCWDSAMNQCFEYDSPETAETMYYINTVVNPLFVVDPAAHTTPAPESPLAAFFNKPYAAPVIAAVVVAVIAVLAGAAFIIRRHWFAPVERHDGISVKYRLKKKLGQGGFGQVFLVERRSDKQEFALKLIQCNNDDERSGALREFEVVKQAQGHRNMITLVELFMNWADEVVEVEPDSSRTIGSGNSRSRTSQRGRDDEVHLVDLSPRYVCIVMQYIAGGDLARYIWNEHQCGRGVTAEWLLDTLARQTCDVLAHLHSLSPPVVHRDLKPENVLLSTNRAEIILTDFGLAQQQEASYMTTRAGSLHYVAPECWDKHYSSAVDMWALGCIIYASATGRVSATNARVMFHDARAPHFADEIRQELSHYSHDLPSFVLALLEVDPRNRLDAPGALRWLDERRLGAHNEGPAPVKKESCPAPLAPPRRSVNTATDVDVNGDV